jgi:hypothetical protein
MRSSAVVVLILAAAGSSARAAVVVPPDPQVRLKSVADRLHTSVIAIRAEAVVTFPGGGNAQESVHTPIFGTGVLVGDGLAITTLHTVGLVEPGRMTAWSDVEALVADSEPVAAKIVASFPDLDLAVLRLAQTPSTESAVLSAQLPTAGETLIAMGTDDESVSVVSVTLAAVAGDQLIFTSTRRVDSRYWGGPVFDAKGRLAGITVPSATPKAVSSLAIAALLDRLRTQ